MILGAIIQTRMSSDRYPGKVLHEVNGKPMLHYLIESINRCNTLDTVVVATSLDRSDDAVADFCGKLGIEFYRGPVEDVAGRFVEALKTYKFDAFVRLNGDSPLLDHRLVDMAMGVFKSARYDMVTNVLKRTFPKGQSVEIIDRTVFERTYPKMLTSAEREHVTRYFYKHQQEFSIYNFASVTDNRGIQLSVDTPEDMETFASIISKMDRPHWQYGLEDILKIHRNITAVSQR